MPKIVVDIVSPYGGKEGGIEDVIRAWTRHLNKDIFDLRVMHMTPGIAYLDGYEKAFFLKGENENVDASYCASGYNLLIEQYGAPDICIATNTPFMSMSCAAVRKQNSLSFPIFSWVHSEIKRYQEAGQGGVSEMLCADRHLVLNNSMEKEILSADPDAVIYNIGNPILHELPQVDYVNPDKLVFVGRLSEIKRIDIILEAIYKAKSEWYLDIIGDGEIRNEVEGWIKLLGLEKRVRVLGWQKNPLPYMADALALVSASDYEGFMITGAEALAMGKPVIGTPTEGLLEYVKDGINGFFFDFGAANALTDILNEIAFEMRSIPSPLVCADSVKKYLSENYFKNIEQILTSALPRLVP